MKRFFSNPVVFIGSLVLLTVLSSSCNRGYGCPSNFSIKEFALEIMGFVMQVIA